MTGETLTGAQGATDRRRRCHRAGFAVESDDAPVTSLQMTPVPAQLSSTCFRAGRAVSGGWASMRRPSTPAEIWPAGDVCRLETEMAPPSIRRQQTRIHQTDSDGRARGSMPEVNTH